MRCRMYALVLSLGAITMWGQTQVDLAKQSKNVDFGSASATRPAKTGTVLPAVCNVGEAFFKSDATPGANLYGCTAANTWTQLSGGGGGGGVSSSPFQPFITDGRVFATSTLITIPAAVYRANNVVSALTTTGTVQANSGSLSAGAQVWIEFDPITKTRFLVSNSSVVQASLSVTNVLLGISNASGFSPGRIPIATCTGGTPANTWMTCSDVRTPFATQVLTAGPGITIGPADALGTQQISAALSNPRVYKTLVNGASSCPAAESTLASYQFPAEANVAAGDSVDITVWFQKTGSSTPAISVRVDGTYANDPGTLGALTMGSAVYTIRTRGLVLSSTSIAYDFDARRDTGSVVAAGSPVFSGAAITTTPLVEFRASGCSGGDTIRVLGAVITLLKGASL